jgi:geranylgeranyl pyrophosphate synthase
MVGNELKVFPSGTTDHSAGLFAPIQEGLAAVETRLGEVVQGQHEALTAATERLLSAGGKRIRPAICLMTAGIFDADPDHAVSLAAAVEMLHTATLVHDDLIDGALLRRGTPTLNVNWSPAAAVLTGDYLFARAANLVTRTHDVRVMNLFAKTLMVILNGEVRQQFSQGRTNRDDYYERIYAKTAAMFVLATEAAAALAGADSTSIEALKAFGRQVGMAYQIVDDVLDFVGSPDQVGKPVGSDLRQGLFTLPALYYVQAHPGDPDVQALLNGCMGDADTVARVVAAVRDSGAVDAAKREAHEFVARGQLALAQVPDSVHTVALSAIADYVGRRSF